MNTECKREIDSPIGKQTADFSGSPVGVVRMDPDKSYIGVCELLQDYINNSNTAAWEKIKKKIDYIYANLDLALGPLAEETDLQNKIKFMIHNYAI